MPSSKKQAAPAALAQLKRLKYVAGDDVFFPGVPRSDVDVAEDPQQHGQVNREMALTLIISGLYADVDGKLDVEGSKKLLEQLKAEAAAAAEEAAKGEVIAEVRSDVLAPASQEVSANG